jgi:hypothetical protein
MAEVKKKKNKSSVFVLPMITGIPYLYFRGFINCYVGCNHDDLSDGRRIYLAFKTEALEEDFYKDKKGNNVRNKKRIEVLESNPLFNKKIIINGFTLFVYTPEERFSRDFDKFVSGKYSKFSEEYKTLLKSLYPTIKKMKSIVSPTRLDRMLLTKDLNSTLPEECEIYSVPELIEETFSLSQFLEIEL